MTTKVHMMTRTLRSMTLLAAAASSSAAFAQTLDQTQMIEHVRRQIQAAQQGGAPAGMLPMTVPGMQPNSMPKQPQLPRQPESALAAQIAEWGATRGPFATESFRDGFSIQGERVLDPEGPIQKFAVDANTGEAGYMAEVGVNQYAIKLMRHQTGMPLTIGTATRNQGVWTVETVTGVRVSGSRLNLSARGFSIARDNAMFTYTAGVGLKSHGLPESFVLAAHQNGDVNATRWLLLEKRVETKAAEGGMFAGTSLGEMVGIVKQLGAIVGVNKSDADFALYNMDTQKLQLVHISLEEKQANFLSQCRQRNKWVAMCDQMETRASLYGQDGYPNRQHYFWRLSWFQTPRGPVAVTMENSIGKIEAVDLNAGNRVTVFERAMGIGGWSATQLPDGRITVTAQMGLSKESNQDVAALFGVGAALVSAGATTAAPAPEPAPSSAPLPALQQ